MNVLILNQALEPQASIQKLINPLVREKINRGFEFTFSTVIDPDKAQFINENYMVMVDGQYFDIVKYRKRDDDKGKFISVLGQHVSYRLVEDDLEFFTVDDIPVNILGELLQGTPFSVGQVDFTAMTTFSIQEETNKRQALILFAEYLGGEIKYDGFEISILERRGADNGVQIKMGKNIKGIEEEVTRRKATTKRAIKVDLLEMAGLPEYKEQGFADLEKIELGDTVHVNHEGIGVDEELRIVSYSYDPRQRINSEVELSNVIESLVDDLIRVERSTVIKDRSYNGIRIGPEHGFEAIRSDKKARTVMNATDGIRVQSGNGTGDTWDDKFYADLDGNLNLEGNITMNGGYITWENVNTEPIDEAKQDAENAKNVAESIAEGTYFGGTFIDGTTIYAPLVAGGVVQAGDFVGGTINIGNGNFTVDSFGVLTAYEGHFGGNLSAAGGTFTGTLLAVTGTFEHLLAGISGGSRLEMGSSPSNPYLRMYDGPGSPRVEMLKDRINFYQGGILGGEIFADQWSGGARRLYLSAPDSIILANEAANGIAVNPSVVEMWRGSTSLQVTSGSIGIWGGNIYVSGIQGIPRGQIRNNAIDSTKTDGETALLTVDGTQYLFSNGLLILTI